MSDITWVKMYVDIFDDRKLSTLMRQEDGQIKVLTWFVLLAYAGKTNDNGKIMYSETQIFTVEHLKLILEYEKPNAILTLNSAINYFVVNDMLLVGKGNKGVMTIKNWGKRQNAEALERARENNRIRQSKYYQNKKSKPNENLTQNITQQNTLENVRTNAILEVDNRCKKQDVREERKELEKEPHFVRLEVEEQFSEQAIVESFKLPKPLVVNNTDYRQAPRIKEMITDGGMPYGWFIGKEKQIIEMSDEQFAGFRKWLVDNDSEMSSYAIKKKVIEITTGEIVV